MEEGRRDSTFTSFALLLEPLSCFIYSIYFGESTSPRGFRATKRSLDLHFDRKMSNRRQFAFLVFIIVLLQHFSRLRDCQKSPSISRSPRSNLQIGMPLISPIGTPSNLPMGKPPNSPIGTPSNLSIRTLPNSPIGTYLTGQLERLLVSQ
ncbi:hypothetical protein TNCV_1900271 [Trichonephila clavipes]|nr:hypothetical protein TNCV_1900271 [Trichonephila clavipes]